MRLFLVLLCLSASLASGAPASVSVNPTNTSTDGQVLSITGDAMKWVSAQPASANLTNWSALAAPAGTVVTQGNSFAVTVSNQFQVDKTHAFVPSNSVASRALIVDAANQVTNSTVTATELDFVHGVTSALQTQLDAKAATTSLPAAVNPNANQLSTNNAQTRLEIIAGALFTNSFTDGGMGTNYATKSWLNMTNGSIASSNGTAINGGYLIVTNTTKRVLGYFGTNPPTIANGSINATNNWQWDAEGQVQQLSLHTNGTVYVGKSVIGPAGSASTPAVAIRVSNEGLFDLGSCGVAFGFNGAAVAVFDACNDPSPGFHLNGSWLLGWEPSTVNTSSMDTYFARASAGVVTVTSSLIAKGSVTATNGIASYRSNLVAPTSITAPATTVNWTNPISSNIQVYIDNSGVTGTSIKKNGGQIFSSLIGDVTIGLQSGEYISLTYTIGTPVVTWSPF